MTVLQATNISIAELLTRVLADKERVVIESSGKRLFAVVPLEDLDALEAQEDAEDLEAVAKAFAEQGDEPPRLWEDVKKDLGL